MDRVAIVGTSGSGKSTLARDLGERLGVAHVELDALFHQPDWEPTPTPEFRAKVAAAIDRPRWIVDGNYRMASDLVQGRADTIVLLDLRTWRVVSRVTRRSIKRVVTRETMWGTNSESWRNLVSRDPEVNIILWSWTMHPTNRERYRAMLADGTWAHATVHHLRSPREVRTFLEDAA